MPENKFEFPVAEPEQEQEKKLNPEEREQLKGEMGEYLEGLKACIEEIKGKIEAAENEEEKEKMMAELAELEEQAVGMVPYKNNLLTFLR